MHDRMGDSITEGSIKEWTKGVGEAVAVDEVVCVIETDKVGREGEEKGIKRSIDWLIDGIEWLSQSA